MTGIDLEKAGNEALEHFANLLRIDTSNPPGNEDEAVNYIRSVLDSEGIPSETFVYSPGRSCIVARLRGKRGPGLILDAHLDTVPATDEGWTRPPFAGDVYDGCLWGRGALDMKHMVAMSLETLVLFHRHKLPLERDLALVLTPDEETGARGIEWLANNHPEQLEAEYALGEVGGMTMWVGENRIYPVQVAQKGVAWIRLTISGEAGHGSVPVSDGAMFRAGKIISRLQSLKFPVTSIDAVDDFLDELGSCRGFAAKMALRLARNRHGGHWLRRALIRDGKTAATLRALTSHTVNPTVVKASDSLNVTPDSVQIDLDCRLMPGTTPESFADDIRRVLGAGVKAELMRGKMGSVTSRDTDMYRVIESTVTRMDPGAKVVSWMVPGFTNGHAYINLGVKYYGFTPLMLPRGMEFQDYFHSANEKCPVSGFKWGLKTLFEISRQHVSLNL